MLPINQLRSTQGVRDFVVTLCRIGGLLGLLPVIVGHRIKDPESEVWQLVLLLRQVVDLICAPATMADQVAYLRVLIEEYVHFRSVTFPSKPLKPKHHYLCHYPELIKQFGPLIHYGL